MEYDDEDDIQQYQARQQKRQGESRAQKSVRQVAGGDTAEDDDEPSANNEESPELSSSDELAIEEEEARHPFYHYATEKADSFADAKVIYQRHRLDTKTSQDFANLSLSKSTTLPSILDGGFGPPLNRTSSLASRKSVRGSSGGGQAMTFKKEPFPSFQQSPEPSRTSHDVFLDADAKARAHNQHPALPHEFKDPLLAHEGMHGAGAGVGLGSGPSGLAKNEESIVSEVQSICDKIKLLLDMRREFMKTSLQCPGDNPKDYDEWEIYPPPPEPVWTQEKNRVNGHDDENPSRTSSGLYMPDTGRPDSKSGRSTTYTSHVGSDRTPVSPTTARRRRKPGHDIGEDFDMSEVDIPGEDTEYHYAPDAASIYQVYDDRDKPVVQVPTLRDYYIALDTVLDICSDGPTKSFAYRRMQYLEGRYNLYSLLNEYEEVADTKKVPHRDFYNVRKVDTHVHHSACMNQKHLLRFIKSKMKKCPTEVVIDRDGKQLTLQEVFESINLTAYDLSIDTLDMHAHTDSFHRFDKFNLKYNPVGQSRLRDIFLKTDNFIKGRYLAEITREVISDLEASKYQMVEWRISVYGRSIHEWDTLAAWVVDNKLFSHNIRWLVQIPRLFGLYKAMGTMETYDELLRNIFQPLFEVTQNPASHPKLYVFLQRVIGFDSVDDESKPERRLFRKFPVPKEWNTKQNPPYGYWIYHLYANMSSLNAWRQKRGFNTFLLRPHCGEAGDTDHLAAALLCCHSISHGITLRKVPMLQYLFYLEQIGIAMSPLSNNALFLTYDRNPFISYFKRGLNVSLSTDDPLQFAFTKEPLIEEYSVAAQIYKLSAVDMCELAKHSVDQSGFELSLKQRWLGKYCYLPGVLGNDVAKCNVPDVREAFRHETLKAEHAFIAKYTKDYTHLERCTPSIPEPDDPSASMSEVYKVLESPKQYYATVADSIPPAQQARVPNAKSSSNVETLSSSPPRLRKASTQLYAVTSPTDPHISGHEPRVFPGIAYQRERRHSLRKSISGSEGTAPDLSSSQQLEPALAKLQEREDSEAAFADDTD
ncbi:AMP deaminase [Cyphellophora europaea CBS 101466]|uniref:AMP deaminase n=1 Tax=Cyphellophora europaea (strain CBS 101466) TaxID=1220924 RepID=W2RKV7_CYPE1|nr:AMP deaminase [Cyphellophora europaea CBS 101466]ETN37127.1 AMP deaminase [Cyphellophora europaea CBS 101466]